MKQYSISDIKDFMNKILIGTVFDRFYLCDGEIATFTKFQLGGYLNRPYFDSDEWEALEGRNFCLWSEVKPVAYQLVKGSKLPVYMKLVFELSKEHTRWVYEKCGLSEESEMNGLIFNVNYANGTLTCTSGVSYKTFSLDKTVEHYWDETAAAFLKQNKIIFETET